MNSFFRAEIDKYVSRIRGFAKMSPLVKLVLHLSAVKAHEDLNKFAETNGIHTEEKDERVVYTVPPEHRLDFLKLHDACKDIATCQSILSKGFLVSLVSQFDAYMGRLIRAMYLAKPELLGASEKLLSFGELNRFASLDEAKEYIIEKEVESVLRKSHFEQFAWLETKLSTPLTKGLDSWECFVELTQRRNLFVHCDGLVSSQYLKVCASQGVRLPNGLAVGDFLDADSRYFEKAYSCVFEIGVKLGQVMGRRLQPDCLVGMDSCLINISYGLILNKEYNLALRLLEFGMNCVRKWHSEENRLIILVNKAQALKWSGRNEECLSLVNDVDWSACSDKFKLANAVLTDDFGEAARMMRRIGSDGELEKTDYKDWPLFAEFRESNEFLSAFEEVFGSRFSEVLNTEIVEIVPGPEDEVAPALEL